MHHKIESLDPKEEYVLKVVLENVYSLRGYKKRYDNRPAGIVRSILRERKSQGGENEATIEIINTLNSLFEKKLIWFDYQDFYNGAYWKKEGIVLPHKGLTLKIFDDIVNNC